VSGWVARCSGCGLDVVVRRWRVRFGVTCPHCRARVEVPSHLDFRRLDRASDSDAVDAESMSGVLALSLIFGCCLPMAAWSWWWSEGAVGRARADERPVPPTVRRLRAASAIATLAYAAFWILVFAAR
jgi:hypothetical protein